MASVSGNHRLFHAGKREVASCDAIAPAMKRNMWKVETGSRVDGTMLLTSLPPRSKEDLLCPPFTRSRRKEKCCVVTKATRSTVGHLSFILLKFSSSQHSGILHIALGSWALFTLGLEVSKKYGSFTFLLLYVLGGISGNLISFLHTPEPSVGGTEPIFAIIGAWLIYQVQSKDEISEDAYDRMFQIAIITTACIFVLSNFGPIDDWAHFGSAFVGIAYGFVTCPIIEVKDASMEAGKRERVPFVRRYSDPRKSLLYFSTFMLLSCLLLVFEPPLDLI